MHDKVASTGQSSQDPARLLRMNLEELGCVATGDPAVRSHVLKHELILLQTLESPLAHILLLETESPIGGGDGSPNHVFAAEEKQPQVFRRPPE